MLLLLVLMGACNSGSVMTQATGFAYEVVVVMDQKDWKGPAGEAIKSELASSVPGLPQAEPSLKITYVQPKDFTGLLRYVRNILVVMRLSIRPADWVFIRIRNRSGTVELILLRLISLR